MEILVTVFLFLFGALLLLSVRRDLQFENQRQRKPAAWLNKFTARTLTGMSGLWGPVGCAP